MGGVTVVNLIKVDIQTGQVLDDNLQELWVGQSQGITTDTATVGSYRSELPDELLRERVKLFNTGRRRSNKNAWSDAELYRLAVLMGRQKRNYKQASARLNRTPRACQFMCREMTKAGVI